jgi:hypothetical protein
MKTKPQKCPACGHKKSHVMEAFRVQPMRVCANGQGPTGCYFTCADKDWNFISLAVQAAEARKVKDENRHIDNAWPNRLKEEFAFAAECERRGKGKP